MSPNMAYILTIIIYPLIGIILIAIYVIIETISSGKRDDKRRSNMSRLGEFISDGKGGLIHGTSEEILDELITRIKWEKEGYEYRIKKLENQISILEDPFYKDKEIEKLKKELQEAKEDLWRGFPISKKENDKINEWIDKHTEEKHGGNPYAGAIGGRYSYTFQPTTIGTIGTIKCICGEEFTFQDL